VAGADGTVWEAQALVAEALDAPAVYRGLSTEYTDVGRLVEYLGDRLFSGVVRVTLPGREAHVVLFRGRPQAVRYQVEDRVLEGAEAARAMLADSRWLEGEVWVYQLPEELFPEEWDERPPVPWEAEGPHVQLPAVEPPPAAVEAAEPQVLEPSPIPEPQEAVEAQASGGTVEVGGPEPAREVDVVAWVRLLEGLVARFRRYRGPSAAGRLEAEVNAALEGSGLRLGRGRVEGAARDPEALRLATFRAVGFLRGMAGQAFAEQSLAAAARDAGMQHDEEIQQLLKV
jgi:hypothetical protein